MIGLMGTLRIESLDAGERRPTGGRYIVHLWYRDASRPGIERHEAGELIDQSSGIISELDEVLGTEVAAKIRTLRPGQQAVIKYGQGLRERTRLVHRIW